MLCALKRMPVLASVFGSQPLGIVPQGIGLVYPQSVAKRAAVSSL